MSFITNYGSSILEINLNRLTENYKTIKSFHNTGAECGGVIKADAYGLGMLNVSESLYSAGCRHFFVSYMQEALELRKQLSDATIYTLHGIQSYEVEETYINNIIPILGNFTQLELWNNFAKQKTSKLPVIIKTDTGMGRFGFSPKELLTLVKNNSFIEFLDIKYILSHLACAHDPNNEFNAHQLMTLKRNQKLFNNVKVSFANSAAIFLGKEYHFNLTRVGAALYGINPTPTKPPLFKQVATIKAHVLQIKTLDDTQNISYNCSYIAKKGDRIAILACGYGDGYPRILSNNSYCYFNGYKLPIIGTITMDAMMIDVSSVPEQLLNNMKYVELMGDNVTVDCIAEKAKTIGWEILTSLGVRFKRIYI